MTKPLLEAIHRRPVDRPPVWIMRQAGRYLPEYRDIRKRHSFQDVVATPEIAAEITLQPIRRFDMDGAVIFADIMTPLEAMGVPIEFDPGPKLEPMTLEDVAGLGELDIDRVANVAETIRLVNKEVPAHTATIGFAGAPVTLLAYLLEGGGSKDFIQMRAALRSDPTLAAHALERLAGAMNTYLAAQIAAGAEVVQLFDTWAGLLDRTEYEQFAVPWAKIALDGLAAPTIYFAPGAGHTLGEQVKIGADGYGLDWRTPLADGFELMGDRAIQGNLDPAILRSDPTTIIQATRRMIAGVERKAGHIANLGHGIDRRTDPALVKTFVEAIRS